MVSAVFLDNTLSPYPFDGQGSYPYGYVKYHVVRLLCGAVHAFSPFLVEVLSTSLAALLSGLRAWQFVFPMDVGFGSFANTSFKEFILINSFDVTWFDMAVSSGLLLLWSSSIVFVPYVFTSFFFFTSPMVSKCVAAFVSV